MRSISLYALNLMISFKITSCSIISKISMKFSWILIKAAESFRFMWQAKANLCQLKPMFRYY